YGSASSRTFTSPPEWATTHSSSRRQAVVRVGDHKYMRADAIGIMATPERTSNAIAPPSAVVVITAQRADRWRHLPCSQDPRLAARRGQGAWADRFGRGGHREADRRGARTTGEHGARTAADPPRRMRRALRQQSPAAIGMCCAAGARPATTRAAACAVIFVAA